MLVNHTKLGFMFDHPNQYKSMLTFLCFSQFYPSQYPSQGVVGRGDETEAESVKSTEEEEEDESPYE